MKNKILALVALALISASARAADENHSVNISGQLKGLTDTMVVMSRGVDRQMHRDTILTPNGKFNFTVNVANVSRVICQALPANKRIYFQVLAVPGEKAVLTGDLSSSYYYSGSKFYTEYGEADRAWEEANRPVSDLGKQISKAIENNGNRDSLINAYEKQAPALEKQANETMLGFYAKHPDSEGAAAFIHDLSDVETMRKAVALLSPEVRNGRMKDYYELAINRKVEEARQDSISKVKQASGVVAPDFTLYDINGNPLSLSSLRGKYVVLDFWGTWCIWCVRGIPKMKEYYNKYKDKFEILSIDCNETQDKWKAGVKKYELPWLHVYQPRQGVTQTTDLYAIQGFPTKILVGPDGKIVKTVVGEDPAFYTFLDETFGK